MPPTLQDAHALLHGLTVRIAGRTAHAHHSSATSPLLYLWSHLYDTFSTRILSVKYGSPLSVGCMLCPSTLMTVAKRSVPAMYTGAHAAALQKNCLAKGSQCSRYRVLQHISVCVLPLGAAAATPYTRGELHKSQRTTAHDAACSSTQDREQCPHA